MPDVTAAEASRSFAELLGKVEHQGERYSITRNGHVVARLVPVLRPSGADAKALLRRHRLDRDWADDLPGIEVRYPH